MNNNEYENYNNFIKNKITKTNSTRFNIYNYCLLETLMLTEVFVKKTKLLLKIVNPSDIKYK